MSWTRTAPPERPRPRGPPCRAATVSAAGVSGGEQAGEFGDRLRGGLELAADVLRLLVAGLRHQHQQRGSLLAEVGQGSVAVLVQVPARSQAARGGVLVQQRAGLPVRQTRQAGVRADIAGADDLARTWAAVGGEHRPTGAAFEEPGQQPGGAGVPVQELPYANSRSSQWLFPGRQPGQPMNPVSLQVHLREIGVPPQRGRTSAIRQLVLQAPAPVIAKALGYHDKTTTRLVTEAGGTWSRYAPGGH